MKSNNHLTPEQLMAANKANLETLIGLTSKAFSGFEQLYALNLNVAKAILADSKAQTQAAITVKDVKHLLELQSKTLQPMAQKVANYNRSLYDIATQTNAHLSHIIEEKTTESQRAFEGFCNSFSPNTAGSDAALGALFKSAVFAGQSSLESVQKAVRQAAEMVDENKRAISENLNRITSSSKKDKKR